MNDPIYYQLISGASEFSNENSVEQIFRDFKEYRI